MLVSSLGTVWALAWLVGCGAPTSDAPPAPTDPGEAPVGPDGPPSEIGLVPDGVPGPDGVVQGTPQPRVPADATVLPDAYRCPEQGRGSWGCFRRLPGGTFAMGAQATDPSAPNHDPAAAEDEGPVHTVTVSPFWIHAWEVTAGAYQQCLDAGWCDPAEVSTNGPMATVGHEEHREKPAVGVTWAGAQRYCTWFGGRLPTEAEWAFAARGTEARRFPWGDVPKCPQRIPDWEPTRGSASAMGYVGEACEDVRRVLHAQLGEVAYNALSRPMTELFPPDEMISLCLELEDEVPAAIVARMQQAIADKRAAGVRRPGKADEVCRYEAPINLGESRDATPEQIMGLAGNVWEWTADWYGPYPSGRVTDPTGPATGTARVQRGGSWTYDDPLAYRSALRGAMPPDAELPDVGFRCVWDGDRRG